jgi:hypothetical protein
MILKTSDMHIQGFQVLDGQGKFGFGCLVVRFLSCTGYLRRFSGFTLQSPALVLCDYRSKRSIIAKFYGGGSD